MNVEWFGLKVPLAASHRCLLLQNGLFVLQNQSGPPFLGIQIVHCTKVASKSLLSAPRLRIQMSRPSQLKKSPKWEQQRVLQLGFSGVSGTESNWHRSGCGQGLEAGGAGLYGGPGHRVPLCGALGMGRGGAWHPVCVPGPLPSLPVHTWTWCLGA